MSTETAKSVDSVTASMTSNTRFGERTRAGGVFHVQCVGADGQLKWEDSVHNRVVNQGLQDMNLKYFTATGYTAGFFLGLITGPGASNTYAAGDTMASHAGWTEFVNYAAVTRPAALFGSASLADPSVISVSAITFIITSTGGTVAGAFLTTDFTKGGTSGTLFSEANFLSPGDRVVANGDSLIVTYTFSLDAT